ncbi:MAG: hypothetical protein HYT70_00280 [Candidatus Aenigmarchaeota archaeon]|nr:hypothetical protein [Candidatus Aenigmarchaeota archaeon]
MKVEFKAKIDYEKYGGKYIAILDNETIVGGGEDVKEVWEEARKKYPDGKISLMKVSRPQLMILICK